MKRMMIRLSALTAVISLGTFAVVQAQRSSHPVAASAAAPGEPATLVVDERTVKPMPAVVEAQPMPERYAQAAAPATAVDPFQAAPATAAGEGGLTPEEGTPFAPIPEDPQGIPPAAEALRGARNTPAASSSREIHALGYDAELPTAGQSPDDAGAFPSAGQNEPTLAPPRAAQSAPGDFPPADSAPFEAIPAEPGESPLVEEMPREPVAPAGRYGRAPLAAAGAAGAVAGAAATRGREPAPFPTEGLEASQTLPADRDAFAPPPQQTRAVATSEGAGRPGGKHLEGPQTPHLTLEKIAPPDVQVGKPAVFVLKIRNTGTVPAAHVEVHDQIPKGAQLMSTTPRAAEKAPGELVWTLGTLKAGEETSVELELMPVAEGEMGSVATVHFAAESSVRTMVTKPVLTLDVKAPAEVLLGEEMTMAIKLSNTGTGTATEVVIREAVPENLQHPAGPELEYEVGMLRPGETRELNLTMRAAKAGRTTNMLTAMGAGSLRVEQGADLEVVAPALEVKMDGPTRRYLDRQATYTVTVTNPGTAAAHEISLVTQLPPGLKFVEANNAGQYNPQTRAVHWLLDELPANESGSVTLVTVPVEIGEQLVRIESTADRGLAAQEEKKILVEGVAAINFEVVDVADPVEVGGETAYEIHVVNQGTKAATNVQVVMLLPEELQPTGAEGPARYTIDGQRVLFEPLAQIAPKADTTYRVKVQGRGAGDVRVRVQVLTDEIKSPVTKEESTRVYADE